MVSVEYANAYSEVLEILKFISKEDYNKIPASKIELFKLNSNKEYKFTYNPNKTLDEQNVSKRAKAIIGILFKDNILHLFGATPGNYKYSKISLIFSLFCSIIFIANLPE